MASPQTGADIIARSLEAHGVRRLFVTPGEHATLLLDAVRRTTVIAPTLLRSEAAAVMAADAYARTSSQPGVVVVSHGMGASAAVAGLQEAWGNSSPVLLLTTQVPSQRIAAQQGALGDQRDVPGLFASCARSAITVDNPYALSREVHEAFVELAGGRPRPVMRAFPVDFLQDTADMEIVAEAVERDRPEASDVAVERSVDTLRWAQRPVIIAGGGVVQAGAMEPLVRLAELIHAPIHTTIGAKGIVSDEHPLARGTLHSSPLAQEAIAQADVALAVGLRFTELDTDGWAFTFAPDATLIHIDIDNTAFDKNYEAQIPICADAQIALEQLLTGMVNTSMRGRRPTIASLQRERRSHDAEVREAGNTGLDYVDAMRRACHPQTIVVCDRAPITDWMARHFPVYAPRTFLYPAGGATRGFAVPAIVGVRAAVPDGPVVAVTGVDGYMRSLASWETILRDDLKCVCVVWTDDAETDPDIAKLGTGLGVKASTVDSPRRLRSAVQQALSAEEPAIIEVRDPVAAPPALLRP